MERVTLFLDAAVHVNAASGTGVALNRRARVDDLELLAVGRDGELVPRHHRDHREERALGLPALGAAARMIERHVRPAADRDRRLGALARQGTAGEIGVTFLYAVVHGGMN